MVGTCDPKEIDHMDKHLAVLETKCQTCPFLRTDRDESQGRVFICQRAERGAECNRLNLPSVKAPQKKKPLPPLKKASELSTPPKTPKPKSKKSKKSSE